jgi:hypothetical protein
LTIANIRPSHINDLPTPIWIEKRETANRVRDRIDTIIAKKHRHQQPGFRNPAELTRQLRVSGPSATTRHCPMRGAAMFMAELKDVGGRAAAVGQSTAPFPPTTRSSFCSAFIFPRI